MKINEVIRKYRKEQNLTQEQIANYLGVSAPAVNKWESGMSYPDITLLPSLARVLKIDIDTLFSFHEELADKEINEIIMELSEWMKQTGFAKGFEKGETLIKEYPNCDKLILYVVTILNYYLRIMEVEEKEEYESKIINWYETVMSGKEPVMKDMAAASLCQIYMEKKDYEKAQQLLDKIPPLGYDKRITQAFLFADQGKSQEAYEIYEQMLYKSSNEICNTLQLITWRLCKEKEFKRASKYAELGRAAAELFDLGDYNAYSPGLFIAIEKQEKEESIRMLEKMADSIDTIDKCRYSPLYSHIKFGEGKGVNEIKREIKKALESDEKLDFIREEPDFKRITNKLEV